ncbi:MAG TPA: DinB family protein, partial [Spirochaetia bacterium]|nr:DinB family protein [Spirochaetia bacterium]
RLVHIGTEELEASVTRLARVRSLLNRAFAAMSLQEFRRLRKSERREVSPEWVLHHLLQHEAEHRGQINLLKRLGGEARRTA